MSLRERERGLYDKRKEEEEEKGEREEEEEREGEEMLPLLG